MRKFLESNALRNLALIAIAVMLTLSPMAEAPSGFSAQGVSNLDSLTLSSNLVVDGTSTITGAQTFTGNASFAGSSTITGNLIVNGISDLANGQIWLDDFLGDTVNATYTEISGSDAEAVQAIAVGQYGLYQLTSGDAGTGTAADLEAVHLGLEWSADQGDLVFEARLHLDTAITTARVCAGFTDDTTTVENPATISGTTITTTASDALVFCFDTDATTDEWYAVGVAGDTDATGNLITGTAPVADTYQILRIEVDADGAGAQFYIDGTLVVSLTANAVTAATLLSPFISVDSADTAASQVVDIDYIYVAATRD